MWKLLASNAWNAGVAIGTIFLACVTYLTLRELRKGRKIELNRQIADKIYGEYLTHLKDVEDSVEVLTLNEASFPDTSRISWEAIGEENHFLARQARIRKGIRRRMQELADLCERFEASVPKFRDDLFRIYEEEEKKEFPQLRSFGRLRFASRLGHKHSVHLEHLIFLDKTFDEWWAEKLENNPHLSVENIGGKFQGITQGPNKKEFDRIHSAIKRRIQETPALTEFVKENRRIHREAKSLERSVRRIYNRLALV